MLLALPEVQLQDVCSIMCDVTGGVSKLLHIITKSGQKSARLFYRVDMCRPHF